MSTLRKFDIITDSACDMSQEYLAKNGLVCVKLGFTMNNVNYEGEEGERIDEKTFYQKLREGAMPTTYQVTGETAQKYMRASLEKGRDVLVITFSSGLSGTAGSFVVAMRELSKKYRTRKIIVVDSLCASMGEGLLLDYVVRYADDGASIEDTAKYAEELKLKICHQFTVDNLFHLKRGGRVSSMTAIVGSILKIKPIMKVDDFGKLVATGKAMGRKKSLKTLVENVFESMDIGADDPIFISHGDCIEDVEYVVGLLKERLPKNPITIGYVGTVIGTHSGVGTLAIFHKGKKR
ncbi:MAG: DegV family protein [Clostridiales bacterium]|nr:DegV family protein [Clostridiales bacterium]